MKHISSLIETNFKLNQQIEHVNEEINNHLKTYGNERSKRNFFIGHVCTFIFSIMMLICGLMLMIIGETPILFVVSLFTSIGHLLFSPASELNLFKLNTAKIKLISGVLTYKDIVMLNVEEHKEFLNYIELINKSKEKT